MTTPAKLHAQFCFWVIAQVFRKHGQRRKAGCEGARSWEGAGAGQWGVGHGARVWVTCRPLLAAIVAGDQQLLNLRQMSCWAVDKGLDLGNFLT